MNTTRLRAAVAYLATAAFFVVAALGQLQGQLIADSFIKATVACVATVILGGAIVAIVEAAARRSAEPPPAATTDRRTPAAREKAEQTAEAA